jgi:hypothetical protein
MSSETKECTQGGERYGRAEGLVVVDAMLLGEALGTQTGFESGDGTISMEFAFEHPLTTNCDTSSREWDKCPGTSLDQGFVFFSDSRCPKITIRGGYGLTICHGVRVGIRKEIELFWMRRYG